MWNHYHNENNEHTHHSPKFLILLVSPPCCPFHAYPTLRLSVLSITREVLVSFTQDYILRFIYAVICVSSLFLFCCWIVFSCMDIYTIYLLIHLLIDTWVVSGFWHFKKSCFENLDPRLSMVHAYIFLG